jgi:hypothetical protein
MKKVEKNIAKILIALSLFALLPLPAVPVFSATEPVCSKSTHMYNSDTGKVCPFGGEAGGNTSTRGSSTQSSVPTGPKLFVHTSDEATLITQTSATLHGAGGMVVTLLPGCVSLEGFSSTVENLLCSGSAALNSSSTLPITAYFRYSSLPISPVYCNDIYGSNMISTNDIKLGQDSPQPDGQNANSYSNGMNTFSQGITNLRPNTTYYYCAILSNRENIAYGGESIVKEFHTNCNVTTAETKSATSVRSGSARLNGSFCSTNPSVETSFEYREAFDGETSAPEWRKVGKLNREKGDKSNIYGNFSFNLSGLTSGTEYKFQAVAEAEAEIDASGLVVKAEITALGLTLDFTTLPASTSSKPSVECTLPQIYNWSTKACASPPVPKPDLVASVYNLSQYTVDVPHTFSAVVRNLGGVLAGGPPNSVYHLFQYDEDADHNSGVANFIASTIAPINARGGTATITNSHTFSSTGTKYIRACADLNDSFASTISESNENNNCSPWVGIRAAGSSTIGINACVNGADNYSLCTTKDGVCINGATNPPICITPTVTCTPPQFYDTPTGTCINPISCELPEVYFRPTNSCVTPPTCVLPQVLNPSSNTCITPPSPEFCQTNPTDLLCLPGPGWTWDGSGWTGGNWNGGTWTGGGWNGDTWNGGTWNGTEGTWDGNTWTSGGWGGNGNTWSGGGWRNGSWSGGSWKNKGGIGVGGAGNYRIINSTLLVLGQVITPPWDAIVRYHEGIEHVFARQIKADREFAKLYGYVEGADIQTFAWDLSHLFAKMFGYVDSSGREIRVSFPDIAAYQLQLTGNKLTVYEYYAGKIVDVRNVTTDFKNASNYEYYYKK